MSELPETVENPQKAVAQPPLVQRLREACNGHPAAKIPWPHRILHEAAEMIEALAKDKERMDWLETQDCWIGVYGEYDINCRHSAGGCYADKVRNVCDENLPLNDKLCHAAESGRGAQKGQSK